MEYEAGKVYYMRIWLDIGAWVSSIRTDRTYERQSYKVKSHNPERAEYLKDVKDKPEPSVDLIESVEVKQKS